MDASVSGRGADVRFRLEGKLVSRAEYTAGKEKQLAAKRRQPKYLEEDVEWKGGLAQERDRAAAAEEMVREVCFQTGSESFAQLWGHLPVDCASGSVAWLQGFRRHRCFSLCVGLAAPYIFFRTYRGPAGPFSMLWLYSDQILL
jgi:hypothetical protein